ncbi:hypothetical protein GH714_037404 [Hevea brasiliensis]|uniref:Uncharacterized protein n=1 Tax=Hevea brasiliensis TaxID=3981 RepID=A0A6A6KL06_HEVBR|nr:hypothetical protein GH714_037404 [Hevea brasiliensis]
MYEYIGFSLNSQVFHDIRAVTLATKVHGPRRGFKKYDARKGHCDYCNLDGHTREGCFKLIGYPDWFKNQNKTTNQQAQSQPRFAAPIMNTSSPMAANTPLDRGNEVEISKYEELSSKLGSLQLELQKLLKGKSPAIVAAASSQTYPVVTGFVGNLSSNLVCYAGMISLDS